MGYYAQVGVGQPHFLDSAIHWYTLASQEHEDLAKVKVERRRMIARERMETDVVQEQQQPMVGRKVVVNIRKRLYGPSSATMPTMRMPTPLPHELPKTATPPTTTNMRDNDPQTPTQPQVQPPATKAQDTRGVITSLSMVLVPGYQVHQYPLPPPLKHES